MRRLFSALFPCILLLLVLLAAFQGRNSSAALSETELENRIWQLSVVLRGENAEGSGCIYGYDEERQALVIITAGHVLKELQGSIEVKLSDGTVLPVASSLAAEECDLGYVYLPYEKLPEKEKAYFEKEADGKFEEFLQIRESSSLQKNDAFHMPDKISTGECSFVTGYVVDPDRYLEEFGCEMIYADGGAVPGMSGSGMFDDSGRLIGILCGATEQYELAGVPAERIKKYRQ